MPLNPTIRSMTRDDLKCAIDWAANEGWNPGEHDLDVFFDTDPGGYFIREDAEGTPLSVISAVRYGSRFGFIGFYICHPEHRGSGHGWAIWQHAMSHLQGRTVGLDGVIDQQDNYRKSGFENKHRNIRYEGVPLVDTPMDPRLSILGQGLFPSIRDYDAAFFQEDREPFLKAWTMPGHPTRRGFALIEDGRILGYGVIRKCLDGFKIGPLFAETPKHADILFRALAGQVKGQTVVLDVPEPNAAGLELAERYGLSASFETARMYKGPAPDLPLQRIYGITTFELG
ncbi:acetyltransferase (GNAT) family protein [Roseibium hamelinense]|uniref:Acetyltransferase (GNAT) family protein n=1 Tax=Roseibium hamelinense TaxID=150831 RepID=A0A562TGK0_9HYPH|nr:GNAT family N-acetyltransferase [Roseibium hamelinense]MTI46096.1 GNAT family N-acetyltransferase [Roseibium hamelinense]TWI92711.1 acetyltransferase (GNAT) family protein [Roseibium hamelinense]